MKNVLNKFVNYICFCSGGPVRHVLEVHRDGETQKQCMATAEASA